MNFLFLDEITHEDTSTMDYKLRLFVDDEMSKLEVKANKTWTPAHRPKVSPTTKMSVEVQMKSSHLPWADNEQATKEIDLKNLFDIYWTSNAHELTVTEVVVIGKRSFSLDLQFHANTDAESLRSSLKKLDGLLEKYSPSTSIEKYGTAFAKLNPVAEAAFSLASVTFEVLKERHKYDQKFSALLDRLQCMSLLANKVADEIVCKETEILKIISQMFEVMQKVARASRDYVKCVGGPVRPKAIEEMGNELTELIDAFDRAVNVEALRSTSTVTAMDYPMLRYPHVAAGVIYDNPGIPFTPFHQSVFDPMYGPPGHEALILQGYPVAPPTRGLNTFDLAAFHLGFSTAESHSLGRHGDGTPSHIQRAEHDWRIFSSQPWVVSGGIEPTDMRGRSILYQWLDRPRPQSYVCKVPVEGRLCGTEHARQDRALTHIRKHLNAKPYECGGRCDNPACQESFGAPAFLRAHMNPVWKICRFCGNEFLRANVKRHEENCRRRPWV